jgi:hypothetical protein
MHPWRCCNDAPAVEEFTQQARIKVVRVLRPCGFCAVNGKTWRYNS